ncbi:MAG TPA: ecotin family protein [Verrucomicrobiota bacterium]|nr:ecotin family protein [Verrucomicrobiota bacterium]
MKALLALVLLSLALPAAATDEARRNLQAFPPAEPGMRRFVIFVPAKKAEEDFRVQLLVGRTVQTDGVNRQFFGGRLETETIQGWGFDRHILRQLGPQAGTLMAPPPGAKPVERFVTLGGEPHLLRYNSRLPLVVYVPEGVEVRYRVWRADAKTVVAKEG